MNTLVRTALFVVVLSLVSLWPPAAATSQEAGRGDTVSPGYVIGSQDQLSITVFEEPELTGKYRVDNDGYFSFPLLDRVKAGGRTLAELQTALTTALANGYLRSPQVRVEVDQYKSQSIFVSGEVRAPGKIAMTGSSGCELCSRSVNSTPSESGMMISVITRSTVF